MGLTITPLPKPTWGSLSWSPKKKRNQGSLLFGLRRAALLVLMLTTAAEAFWAATRKLPGGGAALRSAGAWNKATVGEPLCGAIQSGLSVATTK